MLILVFMLVFSTGSYAKFVCLGEYDKYDDTCYHDDGSFRTVAEQLLHQLLSRHVRQSKVKKCHIASDILDQCQGLSSRLRR